MPQLQFLDSLDTTYQKSPTNDERVVFDFGFIVKRAWVELVDNVGSADQVLVENPKPNDNKVSVHVKTRSAGPGSGKVRFRVWGIDI